jgi:hypothetical protein
MTRDRLFILGLFLLLLVTPSAASAADLVENFDGVTPPALPAGWAMEKVYYDPSTGPQPPAPPIWQTSAGRQFPPGPAHSGANIVRFNSWFTWRGNSARLYTAIRPLDPLFPLEISFWMYHDPSFVGPDRVQVQVSTDGGATWADVGAAFSVNDGSTGWFQHTVDLSAYAADPSVRIGLLGISEWGWDTNIDDIVITGVQPPPPSDMDGDGTPDSAEQGPNHDDPTYDGNGDGTPDWQQGNVTSFTTYTDEGNQYVTLALAAGQTLSAVQALRDIPTPPAYVSLPYGYFTFTVNGLSEGECTAATLYLPGPAPVTYYKYGPTPDDPTPHWYEFFYDGETGAEVAGNTVILHLCDGKRGDSDLTANGTIVDPGGPAEAGMRPVLYFPYLVNGSGDETELGIINKESYAISGTIDFFEASGTALASRPVSLAARGKVAIASAAIPGNAASAVVTADGQVTGYGSSLTATGQLFNDPGISQVMDNVTIPFTTSSTYWRSGIAVFNPGTEEVTVTVEDLAQGDTTMTLGPKARQFFWVSGSPDRMIASGNIVAMEVFESTRTGGDLGAVALGEANGYELYVPSLLFSSGSFSGVGVRSRSLYEGTITVQGYDGDGNVEEVALGTVAGRGQTKLDLTATLASDTLWAKITGASSATSPIGTPPLPLQGITVYGEDDLGAVGALSLNALRFRRGLVGVVDTANPPTVVVLNPGATAVHLAATRYDASGAVVEESAQTIVPGEMREMMFTSTAGGYVKLESNADLYGYEIIRESGRLEMVPVLQ